MTVGSLFSGIGGLDLGLERAGFRVIWQCESDLFARRVLAKHWPGIPCYPDVRDIDGTAERPDMLCGGFPCQDISKAGQVIDREYAGINGERSGLWSEFARIIRVLRPRFVLVENVTKILDGGLGRVLGDLASIGFDAEWSCLPASAVGAPHVRDRLFLLAYAHGERFRGGRRSAFTCPSRSLSGETPEWDGLRLDVRAMGERSATRARLIDERVRQPDALRDGDGLPRGLDGSRSRRKGVGNAVYPDVAEWLGRRILESVHHAESAKDWPRPDSAIPAREPLAVNPCPTTTLGDTKSADSGRPLDEEASSGCA
jgi:DNA (cytosine-5)-methyltransferase 1